MRWNLRTVDADSRRRHIYVALKVYETGHRQGDNESKVLHHLGSLTGNEVGRNLIRTFRDSFELQGTIGPHVCLVYKPLCMSLEDLRLYAGGKIPGDVVKPLIRTLLPGLNYLHKVAHVVHTGMLFYVLSFPPCVLTVA